MSEGYIAGFRGPAFVDDPRTLPAMVRHLICASGPRREHADGGT
jgi:hypothetical protein